MDRETRLLAGGYALGLILIAGLLITAHSLSGQIIAAQVSDSTVINLAGRQRMLSQRMARDLLLLARDPGAAGAATHEARLKDSLASWKHVHRGLQVGDWKLRLPGRNSKRVSAMFARLEPHYQTIRRSLERWLYRKGSHGSDERRPVPATIQQLLVATDMYLAGMDEIVFRYDAEAAERVGKLKRREEYVLWGALGLLLLEALLIFSPLVRLVQRGRRKLEEVNEALKAELVERKRLETEREELARLKDDFISIASHDLKAPLTTVLAGASIVVEAIPPGKEMTDACHKLVQRIAVNGQVMKQIVEDFLDFQALEDRHVKLEVEEILVSEMLQGEVSRLSDYVGANGVEVGLDLAEGLGHCGLDPARVGQVTMNLLHNAIKFSPRGSRVVLHARRVEGMLEISVEDQGPGLLEDEMGRLFCKYARLSARPQTGEKSSGLGLAICKRLVDLHGGEIGARNNEDSGSTFWFQLPDQDSEPVSSPAAS